MANRMRITEAAPLPMPDIAAMDDLVVAALEVEGCRQALASAEFRLVAAARKLSALADPAPGPIPSVDSAQKAGAPLDLKPSTDYTQQARILAHLRARPGSTRGALAAALGIKMNSLNTGLTRLKNAKRIRRTAGGRWHAR